MSAMFVADGVFDPTGIASRFEGASIEMPARIKDFVLDKIRGYAQQQ
jgi:hypothetical protein